MLKNFFVFILVVALFGGGLTSQALAQSSEQKSAWITELQAWNQQLSQDNLLEPREKDLRREFIHRLIFQIERKYNGQNARDFFNSVIWDMALTDRMKNNQSFRGLDRFLKSLHEALREVLEPRENVMHFIRSYAEYSSLLEPLSLEEFADTRNYFNGRDLVQANPMDLETAAEAAIEKLETPLDRDYLEIETHFEEEPKPEEPAKTYPGIFTQDLTPMDLTFTNSSNP